MANQIEAVLKLLGVNRAERDLRGLSRTTDETAGHYRDLNGRLRDSRGRFVAAGSAARRAGSDVRGAGNDASVAAKNFGGLKEAVAATAKGFAVAAGAVAAVSFVAVGKGAIEASSQMENFEGQLTVLLKSSDKAKQRLAELFEIGSTTPFELGDLVKADTIITSFGGNADQMRTGIMDLAGALGGELPDAAMAVSKSFAAGMGASDGLRESYALLFTDIKRRAEILGDPSDIKIWQAAMIDALTAVDGVVKGGTASLAKTFSGQLSNVSDQWFKFKKKIGDAGLFEYAKLGIAELITGLDEGGEAVDKFATMLSGQLIGSFEGVIRVMTIFSQVILAFVGGVKFFLSAFTQLSLWIDKTRLAWMNLRLAFDVTGTLGKGTVLGDEFRQSMQETEQSIRDTAKELRRTDTELKNMADSFFALNEVHGTLDKIRSEVTGIAEMGPVLEIKTYTPSPIDTSLAPLPAAGTGTVLADAPTAPKAAPKKRKKSQAQKDFEKFQAKIQTMIDADTLASVKKFDVLIRKMRETMNTTRKSSSRDWGKLIALAEKYRGVAKKTADDKAAEKHAKEVAKFVEQMRKAGESARRSALEAAGQWKESDKLGVKIDEARRKIAAFRLTAENLGLSTAQTAADLQAMEANVGLLVEAQKKAREEEREVARQEHRKTLPIFRRMFAEIGETAKTVGAAFRESFKSGLGSVAGRVGGALQGVINLGTGGLGSLVGSAGPLGGAAAGIAQLGGMGYTKTEEFIDERTGEKRTRDVEVSGAEAIGEQMKGFLDGLIVGLVDVLPELIAEVIPRFIQDGIPALIEGLISAIPKIVYAFFVGLPSALARGVGEWWSTVWESIKDFFKSIGKTGGGAAAGAGAGAAVGSLFGPIGTLLGAGIGAIGGGVFGGKFHAGGYATRNYGLGSIDRTGPALLQQGERVVPATGADTQTARQNGLAAFMPSGATVNISTAAIDPDVVDRLGSMLDEQFGYAGRNSLPIFGG